MLLFHQITSHTLPILCSLSSSVLFEYSTKPETPKPRRLAFRVQVAAVFTTAQSVCVVSTLDYINTNWRNPYGREERQQQSKGLTTTASTSEEWPASAFIQPRNRTGRSHKQHTRCLLLCQTWQYTSCRIGIWIPLVFSCLGLLLLSDTAFSSLTESSLESRAKRWSG